MTNNTMKTAARRSRLGFAVAGLCGVVIAAGDVLADCVTGVASNDVLWIRSAPNAQASKIGAIPFNACGVVVDYDRCVGNSP